MQKLESQYFSTPTSTLKKVSIISVIFISHVQSMKSLNVSYQYSRESKIVLRIFFRAKMSSDIKSNGFLPSDLRIGIILFEKKEKS